MAYLELKNEGRTALAFERAQVWRGPLSHSEFAQRNEGLYAHAFGQTRMKTFGWKTEGKIGASLDSIQIALLVGDGRGGVKEVPAWHLASVLTLPECRGKGLATQLIRTYLETERPAWNTLFSGIGPRFYEPFGFRPSYVWQNSRAPLAGFRQGVATEIAVTEFLAAQHAARKQAVQSSPVPACAFHFDVLWWDWYASIYQFFAQVRGHSAPRGRFWRLETAGETAHLAALENRAAGSLDLWWASSRSETVLDFLASQTATLGLTELLWWTSDQPADPKAKRVVPMVRCAADTASLPVLDAQMGDWW